MPFNRRMSLGTKFILLTSSVILITSFIIGLFVLMKAKRDNYQLLVDHGSSLAAMIAEYSEYRIYAEDQSSLLQIIESIKRDPSIAYLFILNADERVLMFKSIENFPIHIPPSSHPREADNPKYVLYKDFHNDEDGKDYIDILASVVSQAQKTPVSSLSQSSPSRKARVIGYVHLGISQEGLKKRIRQFLYSILLFTSLFIVLGIAVTILITRRIVSPINELNRATQDISLGKLDRRIEIVTNDEVADLARAFNVMLERLRSSHDKVGKHTSDLTFALERMKREMIERERAEEALKESEKKYRTIFEESKDVISLSSPESRLLDINLAGVELLRYSSKQELLAIDVKKNLYVDPDDLETIQRLLQERGYVKDFEAGLKRKDGELLTVLITAEAVFDVWGVMTVYRGVWHDVTETRRLEQQLLQAQKMEAIGQLAGGIAHDFNNMLTAITGYGNLLLMDLDEDSPLKPSVDHILSSSERAANLTRGLLAFSRKQILSPKPVDLNDIVTTIEKLLSRIIGENIILRTVLAKRDVMILADSGQLEQVLINLCTNARDAMPGGGIIFIETSIEEFDGKLPNDPSAGKAEPYAVLAVADRGSGMDAKTRGKIFEPFFTTKEQGKGTGLGLSIVYGIIQQHNGHIQVYSEPDRGTVFKIFLPLISDGVKKNEERTRLQLVAGAETVLLAEDDNAVRNLISNILQGSGYKVIEAVDGESAIALYRNNSTQISLLLLDVVMPGKSGKEAYDTIRNINPGIKALFMSGYTADILNTKGNLQADVNFIYKPVSPIELLRKIRQVLDGPVDSMRASGPRLPV